MWNIFSIFFFLQSLLKILMVFLVGSLRIFFFFMSFLFLGRSDSFLYILVFIMRMLKFLVRYFFSFLGLSLWFVLCFCLFIFFFLCLIFLFGQRMMLCLQVVLLMIIFLKVGYLSFMFLFQIECVFEYFFVVKCQWEVQGFFYWEYEDFFGVVVCFQFFFFDVEESNCYCVFFGVFVGF